jgi:hypothetical protein
MTSYCEICDISVNDLQKHEKTQTHQKIVKAYQRGCEDGISEQKVLGEQRVKALWIKINHIRKHKQIVYKPDPIKYKIVLSELIEFFQMNVCKINYSEIEATKNNIKHDLECSICMGRIHKKSEMIRTICNHRFHVLCLLKWYDSYKDMEVPCPLCRRDILCKVYNPLMLFEIKNIVEMLYD